MIGEAFGDGGFLHLPLETGFQLFIEFLCSSDGGEVVLAREGREEVFVGGSALLFNCVVDPDVALLGEEHVGCDGVSCVEVEGVIVDVGGAVIHVPEDLEAEVLRCLVCDAVADGG